MGVAEQIQRGHGNRRAMTTATVNQDVLVEVRQQVEVLGQFVERNIDRTRDEAFGVFVGCAHVDQQQISAGFQFGGEVSSRDSVEIFGQRAT